MGKVEIGIYLCVTADILTKDLQKCSRSGPLPPIGIYFCVTADILTKVLLKIIIYINYAFYCCCS